MFLKLQRQEGDVGENSIHKSVNTKTLPKCNLVDWTSSDIMLLRAVLFLMMLMN